jgi:hypothetical protein
MKIKTLLENMRPSEIMFSDITPEQIGVLIKLNSGEIDIDSADERQFDVMTDLRGMGIIDQEWNLTREGRAAAMHAEKNGGSHDLQKARERSGAAPSEFGEEEFEVNLGPAGGMDDFEEEEEEFDFR